MVKSKWWKSWKWKRRRVASTPWSLATNRLRAQPCQPNPIQITGLWADDAYLAQPTVWWTRSAMPWKRKWDSNSQWSRLMTSRTQYPWERNKKCDRQWPRITIIVLVIPCARLKPWMCQAARPSSRWCRPRRRQGTRKQSETWQVLSTVSRTIVARQTLKVSVPHASTSTWTPLTHSSRHVVDPRVPLGPTQLRRTLEINQLLRKLVAYRGDQQYSIRVSAKNEIELVHWNHLINMFFRFEYIAWWLHINNKLSEAI